MRRTLPIVVALIALLVFSSSAWAIRAGGHNKPTKRLEAAFKVISSHRVASDDGCYPSAKKAAKMVRKRAKLRVAITRGIGGVKGKNLVNVVKKRTRCNRLVLVLASRRKTFVLDSVRGPVYVKGTAGKLSEESRRGGRGRLRALTTVGRNYGLSRFDQFERLEVKCPKGRFPLGGGMVSTPPLGPDGEGVYPHSYERLGVQRGFHITAVVIDPSSGSTTPRRTTIQVVCGRGLVPIRSPHKTVFVPKTQTRSATARCPRGTNLFSGGFQRTNFTTPFITPGGNYITESRAIGTKAWTVTATAFGHDGGELTAIALCARDRSLPITEVSATTPILSGMPATATTPPCPAGRRLTFGGFSFNGSKNAFFAEGYFTAEGTWAAQGYGYFGPAQLTAYGYCLRA
ncbi:MAG: hypothetical protein ACRDL6_12875 [Solirubrobacterales bacterium]